MTLRKLGHDSLAGGPIMLRKGWPHDPAKLPEKWPHEAANRQARLLGVVPTRVGVHRRSNGRRADSPSRPPARGGEPLSARSGNSRGQSSPRAWG